VLLPARGRRAGCGASGHPGGHHRSRGSADRDPSYLATPGRARQGRYRHTAARDGRFARERGAVRRTRGGAHRGRGDRDGSFRALGLARDARPRGAVVGPPGRHQVSRRTAAPLRVARS
jgi:hypothetical protein